MMTVDILQEMEIYGMDPEAYVLVCGGTPEQLYPKEYKELANWLDKVDNK